MNECLSPTTIFIPVQTAKLSSCVLFMFVVETLAVSMGGHLDNLISIFWHLNGIHFKWLLICILCLAVLAVTRDRKSLSKAVPLRYIQFIH